MCHLLGMPIAFIQDATRTRPCSKQYYKRISVLASTCSNTGDEDNSSRAATQSWYAVGFLVTARRYVQRSAVATGPQRIVP